MIENLKSMFIGGIVLSLILVLFVGFFIMMSYEWFAVGIGVLVILMAFGLLAFLFGKMVSSKKDY